MLTLLNREFRKEKWEGQIRLTWFQARMQFDYGLNYKTTRRYLASLEELEEIIVDDQGGADGKGVIMEWYDRNLLKKASTDPEEASPTPSLHLQEEEGKGV